MAITQERFMETIDAGLAWREAFHALAREINQTLALARTNDMDAQTALITIGTLARQNEPSVFAVIVLETEKRYFEANKTRNQKARMRASKYRWSDGVPVRPTAPPKPIQPNTKHQEQKTRIGSERMRPDKLTRKTITEEARRTLTDMELRKIANPDLEDANTAPPPDLSDLFK